MTEVGSIERITQNRVVKLFQEELDYTYLGDWQEREENSNIEESLLTAYLTRKGYSSVHISRAIFQLKNTADNFNDSLYTTNKNVYQQLRYGIKVKADASSDFEDVHLINWKDFNDNDFAIAEEVTIKSNKTKRPDIVIYINGIAVGVIELKRSTVTVNDGIRQNITNQQDQFIQSFFATVQYLFAGNDTEGLRYGTIDTAEKYYLKWKEDVEDDSRNLLDKYLLKMCDKERFIELLYDFVLFDGGVKKLPRVHQYFGVKESQKYVNKYEGGIIWHTQGSGKSITMVWLAKWILENKPKARVVILTDRDELDKQIEDVFTDAGEKIYRTKSGSDLINQLGQTNPRLFCSLVHKFGKKNVGSFKKFIAELESQATQTVGEIFVFIDECHRTHSVGGKVDSGKLHKTMKAMMPNAVFIGFTGTPLLKKDKQTSLEIFGKYIHTYKFNEGVDDKVILDLIYEARDIDQRLSSQSRIDEWFAAKTKGLNDFQKMEIKKKWGTMQKVLSSRSRMSKVVTDIIFDFSTKPRLNSEKGNAILVASSIYEACRYYELFLKTPLKNKCAIVTSYSPQTSDITTEDTGASTETEKEFMYNLYKDLLGTKSTEQYEDWAKNKFKKEPANMQLLVVVSKLLTGFDAPSCTYLYIDKSMQDHGLFQAITRVNRLDSPDKQFGYIVDYKDLFKKLVNEEGTGALQVYTTELEYDNFEAEDIDIMLQDRLEKGKERLDTALEEIALLCEPVDSPKDRMAYVRYFCGNTEIEAELKAREVQRTALYKKTVALIRAYANIADEMEEAGYTLSETVKIKKEIDHYLKLREDIRIASGEVLDLKTYEADMRHLIDTYIQADEPEKISPFGDTSLLDIITSEGIIEAIANLPEGLRSSNEAVAETIENNVRKKIIKEHLIDPAFFEEMSKLLAEIIKARKENAITYEEYLKKIADLAKKVNDGKSEETPDALVTVAQRALYNNLGKDEELALRIDKAVKETKRDDFRGNLPKEREIKAEIFKLLSFYSVDSGIDVANEPPAPYGMENKVERIFDIIKAQEEY